MRTIELYRKHKAGKVSREKFLYEVRRDKNLPWITNITSFDDAVKILKNKGVISEATIKDLFGPLSAKLESMGYSVDIDSTAGYKTIFAYKVLPDGSSLTVFVGPSEAELKTRDYKGFDNFETIDMSVKYYTDQITKKFFGLFKNKERVMQKLSDDTEGENIDLGRGMFEIPIDQSVVKVTDIVKKAEQKVSQMNSNSLNEANANIPTDPSVDRVNPYFLKRGVQMLLAKEKELTNDSYIKALNKAASMLEKNPHAFDEEMFANAKDVEKADAKLETEEVKKANHKNKANEMKKVKVKSLKESAIEELAAHLKKKDLVNEDAHYNYNIGSEVHTPYGKGKVTEIIGGTLTVEMEDGKLVDIQINSADHHTKKAQENQADAEKAERDAAWKKFDSLRGASPETGDQMGPSIGQELNYKPEDIHTLLRKYIDKNKDDKEKMTKLKEALKKLKENISDEEIANAKKTGEVVNVPSSNQQDIQKLKNKKVAYSTYQG
jgi:hypothetical protein